MASDPYSEMELFAEPSLDEILAEPIVKLIMQRDGVESVDMRNVIDHMKRAYTAALLTA